MGFRYSKRIKIGGGAGFNLSKSGVSGSVRTKFGSVSPRGFSIRTGIPGLTYRTGKSPAARWLTYLTVGGVALYKLYLYLQGH